MWRETLVASLCLLACGPAAGTARDPGFSSGPEPSGESAPARSSVDPHGGASNTGGARINLAELGIAGSGPSLPAVTVRSLGLHVGGGPNDSAGKAPFVSAIERRFEDLLGCYRWVSEPGKSGTFGVDLHIERGGGKPRVAEPRAGLSGDKFHDCVVRTFESVQFPAPGKPTVISYSIRFSVDFNAPPP